MKIAKKISPFLFFIYFIGLNMNFLKSYSEELVKLDLNKEINNGYLLIGIKQYLGSDSNTSPKNKLLSLESKKGMLKLISSNGIEHKSKKVDIFFNQVPLTKKIVFERFVSNPFASYESAKKASLFYEKKGLNPKITYPIDWSMLTTNSAASCKKSF